MSEKENRQRAIDSACSWIGTKFHHAARVKGAGVDCVQLIIAAYSEAGLIESFEPERYSQQWHLHREEERYLLGLMKHTKEVEVPLPGDLVMFKIGRTWSHGGIIIEWPRIVHAWFATGVEETDATQEPLRSYPFRFFTLQSWK